MRFLASIPELCDITFLVGETREPVCAVKAVLAARSRSRLHHDRLIFVFIISVFNRVFRKMLFDTRVTRVKEPPAKESKLKALLKRSSEPFMGIQISQQVSGDVTTILLIFMTDHCRD